MISGSLLPYRRAAAVQIAPGLDLAENLRRADGLIKKAVDAGATLIGLPETFTIEYRKDLFASVAEEVVRTNELEDDAVPSTGSQLLASRAEQHAVVLYGGVVERDPKTGKLFNSVVAYGPRGDLLTVYRKIHLSCVSVGVDKTSEADIFAAGTAPAQFQIPSGADGPEDVGAGMGAGSGIWRARVGLAICFDLRFDLHREYTRSAPACEVLTYPSAFLESTGQEHWELLLRARALDEQVFVVAPNHGRSDAQATKMFGHAMICGPYGEVLASTKERDGDGLAVADLEPRHMADIRSRIPLRVVRARIVEAAEASKAEAEAAEPVHS